MDEIRHHGAEVSPYILEDFGIFVILNFQVQPRQIRVFQEQSAHGEAVTFQSSVCATRWDSKQGDWCALSTYANMQIQIKMPHLSLTTPASASSSKMRRSWSLNRSRRSRRFLFCETISNKNINKPKIHYCMQLMIFVRVTNAINKPPAFFLKLLSWGDVALPQVPCTKSFINSQMWASVIIITTWNTGKYTWIRGSWQNQTPELMTLSTQCPLPSSVEPAASEAKLQMGSR